MKARQLNPEDPNLTDEEHASILLNDELTDILLHVSNQFADDKRKNVSENIIGSACVGAAMNLAVAALRSASETAGSDVTRHMTKTFCAALKKEFC